MHESQHRAESARLNSGLSIDVIARRDPPKAFDTYDVRGTPKYPLSLVIQSQ